MYSLYLNRTLCWTMLYKVLTWARTTTLGVLEKEPELNKLDSSEMSIVSSTNITAKLLAHRNCPLSSFAMEKAMASLLVENLAKNPVHSGLDLHCLVVLAPRSPAMKNPPGTSTFTLVKTLVIDLSKLYKVMQLRDPGACSAFQDIIWCNKRLHTDALLSSSTVGFS